MWERVSPERTTCSRAWRLTGRVVVVAARPAPGRIGTLRRVPATTMLGLLMPLSWISRSTLVPRRSAMSERVSPLFTV